jgi:hypothetical protein
MFNDMISEVDLEVRRRKAAEMILDSEIVTASLEDDEAEVLLNWALAEVERYALSSKDMGDEEADDHIAKGVGKVRRLMKMVNNLVEDKDDLSSDEMVEELTNLLSSATEGRRQKAAEVIQGSEPVTTDLQDDEAEVLLSWTVAQADGYVLATDDMGDEEAHEHVAEGMGEVRPLAKIVSNLGKDKDEWSSMEMVEELTRLLSLAMEDIQSSRQTEQMKGEENDEAGDHRRDRARFC